MIFPELNNYCQDNVESMRSQQKYKGSSENSFEVTVPSEITQDGFWRTNNIFDGINQNMRMNSFPLRHTTSFEENCMSKFGKTLISNLLENCGNKKQELIAQINTINLMDCIEDSFDSFIENSNELKKEKNILIEFNKKNFEAKQLILNIFSSVPSQLKFFSLRVLGLLLFSYEENTIDIVEESQLENVIQSIFQEIKKEIRIILEQQKIQINGDFQDQIEENFEKFIDCWMSTIFYGLNGIFQKSEDSLKRRLSFFDLKQEEQSIAQKHRKKQ